MLNVHPVWSLATPIALIESCVPARAKSPWLGRWGIAITAILFALGAVMSTLISLKQDPFVASRVQLSCAAIVCIALIALALRLPANGRPTTRGWIPSPLLAAIFALGLGSVLQLVPQAWGWVAFLAILICDIVALVAVWAWSRRIGWSLRHQLGLAAGAALAYGWHSFFQQAVIPTPTAIVRAGNVIFVLATVCLIWFATKRCRTTVAAQQVESSG
jgi:hypothetical protein